MERSDGPLAVPERGDGHHRFPLLAPKASRVVESAGGLAHAVEVEVEAARRGNSVSAPDDWSERSKGEWSGRRARMTSGAKDRD